MCVEILESSENILQTSNTVSERDLQKKIFRNEIETIHKQKLQKKIVKKSTLHWPGVEHFFNLLSYDHRVEAP